MSHAYHSWARSDNIPHSHADVNIRDKHKLSWKRCLQTKDIFNNKISWNYPLCRIFSNPAGLLWGHTWHGVEDVFNYLPGSFISHSRLKTEHFRHQKAQRMLLVWARSKGEMVQTWNAQLAATERLGWELTVSVYEVSLCLLCTAPTYDLNLAKHGNPNSQTGKI